MITRAIGDLLRDNWQRFGLSPPVPERIEFLKVSSRAGSTKSILFGFTTTGRFPAVIVRIARNEQAAQRMRRAHIVLQRLFAQLSPELRSSLPRPLALTQLDGAEVAVESYLPGRPMYQVYPAQPSPRQRARIKHDFDLALSWLARFHQATRARDALGGEEIAARCAALVEAFAECHRPLPSEVSALQRVLADLPQSSAPSVCQQGDYWPRNLLTTGDRLAVCDWEWAASPELPYLDVFLFPLSYGSLLGAGDRGQDAAVSGMRRAFAGSNWFADLSRTFITAHLGALGVSGRLAPGLFCLALLQMAVRDYRMTGQPSRTDLEYGRIARACIGEDVVARGWLGSLAT